jgi:hypothetical protein
MVSALFLLMTGGTGFAAPTCAEQLADLKKEWDAISFPSANQNAQIVRGKRGHVHTGGQVQYMRNQMHFAAHLCDKGEEHEAMLRMDVVRAWLKLPEVQHPEEHGYKQPAKK